MALSTQPYKGTRDFYPEEMRMRRWMFGKLRDVVQSYSYLEYDGPMLEPFELYAAKTGEEIVNQQLYWLMDRGERKMAIRPEMTPTLARMVAAKFHELPKPVRWFSIPNLWRYERPQRGRLREHWQLNVDLLGGDPLLADAEILNVALDIVKTFGGEKKVVIKINNRKLMDFLFKEKLGLDADAALKVTKAIDARDKIGEEAYQKWLGELGLSSKHQQQLELFFRSDFNGMKKDFMCEGVRELDQLFSLLRESGTPTEKIVFDPSVIRGLDYYTGTVFEMYDTSPENRRAIFGGGRYDNLLGLFGNYKLSGVGLGMGDVTLGHFLETHHLLPTFGDEIDLYVTLPKLEMRKTTEKIARDAREKGLRVMTALSEDSFAAQLKAASKAGVRFVALLGDDEYARGSCVVKDLRDGQQTECLFKDVADWVQASSSR